VEEIAVPKKKHVISDEERRKRLREAARELETSNDPKDFEKAFKKVVREANSTRNAN
jgi:hypothetical protein